MAELSRYGHRQRMRTQYLVGGMKSAPDHNLLELFLSLVIPQKDVKPLAYDLINTFGSLENVINADASSLMTVKGVGESTAVAICLIKDINKRVVHNKNKETQHITSTDAAINYCQNLLSMEKNEVFVIITLRNDGSIINNHFFENGTTNDLIINTKDAIKCVINDNAASVIISHNHPDGKPEPSVADVDFTVNFRTLLGKINVSLLDHIIVGKSSCSSFAKTPNLYCNGSTNIFEKQE